MVADESDQPEERRGSFAKPVPGLEARVVDPESLSDAPAGMVGELWMRGRLLMEGYYGRERWETFTPDQWYRTGDLFTVDSEGFFYFKGRRGDMIKTGGANVSPREVEAVLRELTGGLLSIVFGLPDAERGQIVTAVIVAPVDSALDLETIQEGIRARLSAYKRPKKLIRMEPDEIPMRSSGKPDVKRLIDLLLAAG